MNDRNSLLDKIRALLSKTVENGCTESEALAALDKARAMMDAHEVTEADLKLTKEEKAVFKQDPAFQRDPHKIRWLLCYSIGKFCGVEVWRHGEGDDLRFCGMKSDVDFAQWLLDSLSMYVRNELAGHLIGNLADKSTRRLQIKSFVLGATGRIGRRMLDLVEQSDVKCTSNGRALVVVKTQAIQTMMEEMGITLTISKSRRKTVDGNSYAAGQNAGNNASFGRPISGSSGVLRINHSNS
jgi:hypothetical protein